MNTVCIIVSQGIALGWQLRAAAQPSGEFKSTRGLPG